MAVAVVSCVATLAAPFLLIVGGVVFERGAAEAARVAGSMGVVVH
jgi:hypothetical protein